MAPTRSKKRASDQSMVSTTKQTAIAQQKVPLRTDSPSTPRHNRSPIKKRKGAITLQQKQALIDNLQLEITERARRLRAQYNLQSQGLRSRIEIRINRIPVSLRKAKIGDLLLKYTNSDANRGARLVAATKDNQARTSPKKPTHAPAQLTRPAARAQKRMSDAISGNKENDFENNENIENAKKRIRAALGAENSHVRPTQVLSPTSSNSRLANRSRPASPVKSQIARPASPLKSFGQSRSATATSMLSSMVEKAKATRVARKVTAASSTSSSSNGTTAAARTKRVAAPTRAPPSRPATRTARRISANSETSEASTGTVVKRAAAARTATSTVRKGTTAAARKAAAGTTTKRAAAKPAAPASTTATGRVLRKRA